MTKRTISDHIKDLENTRAAKMARLNEISDKSIDEGRSRDAAEIEECEEIAADIKQIDADLAFQREREKLNMVQAAAVVATNTETATKSRSCGTQAGPTIIIAPKDKDEVFKGQNFTRKIIAKAAARLDGEERPAWAIAEERWGKTNPTLVQIMKTAVAGGGTGSGEWGAELAQSDTRYTGDFIEYLYARTVFDQLPLRQIPANVHIKGQDGTATGYWVGESKAIPVSKADFSDVELRHLKVGALAVVSNELIKYSDPSAEMLVRDALVNASSQKVDTTFISTAAASAGVSPAGILNGVSGLSSQGTDEAGLLKDIERLYALFIEQNNATGLWFVMNTALAKSISLLRNSLGQRSFPDMTATGGTLEGDRVVSGENVHGDWLILLKPSDIYRIGDTGVEVSLSRDAMIEQNDAPQGASDTPTAASATLMSMFQTESTAIKVVRSINFAKRRTSAVQYVNDADYGAADSP